jgi:alpha-L-rhamnosidase
MGYVPGGPVVDVTEPPGRISRVEGRVPTIAGPVTVRWLRTGGALTLDLNVPPNATARVTLGGHVHVLGTGAHHLTAS